ncbi:hypothetical protein [Paenisporosarcina sp. TG-14]|uniref:hypothetical protein n=1 Tax=Paenisporosarcina sp. TG-14 TaxID=1231057 RepID=UPI0003041AA7|nr:hypothetical protein [Paenisporosarcina sp. TG-14]
MAAHDRSAPQLSIVWWSSKQAYPSEDVGGPSGYSRYLVELADPNSEDHAQSLG